MPKGVYVLPLLPEIKGTSGSDKRYFPRWEIDKRIVYQLSHNPAEKEAQAVDMSCSGIRLLSEEPLLPTQKIKLNVFLSKVRVVTVTGRVVWIKHIAKYNKHSKYNEAGIVFDDIDQKTQELILEHAFTLKKNDLVDHWFKGWA